MQKENIENKILKKLEKNEQVFSLKKIIFNKLEKEIVQLPQEVFINNIDVLIDVLTHNTEIKNKISNCKKITISSAADSCQSLNKLIDFINFLKNDELLSKPNIEISCMMNLHDQIIIAIKTGVKIIDKLNVLAINKYQLLKNIWNKLENENFDENSLKPIINEVIEEIKNSQKINLNYHNCLRTLSEFEWSKLSQNHAELNISFKNLFKQEQVKSQYYHYKKEDDLHFYMVKVTEKNAHSWKEFTNKQFSLDKLCKYRDGLIAFKPSLNFFDYDKTDVWVAFIANQELDLDQINYPSIEMYVSMLTSENAIFTSHSGVSRCPSYSGTSHNKISADLHSFIANVTLKNYTDQEKSYMITCPVSGTREIIIRSFENKGKDMYYYIGSEIGNSIISKKDGDFVNGKLDALIKRITSQNRQINDGNKKILIKINTKSNKDESFFSIIIKCTSFEIFSQNGEILQTISSEMMNNEFAWFFHHLYLFKGQNSTETLLTTDMKALAGLIDNYPLELEYVEKIEVIGDVELY